MNESGLRFLDESKLKWRLPEDDVTHEVLIPSLRVAQHFDCMVGFFGAQALRQLAPGLASFVSNGDHSMRLLISPLLSDQDLAGIRMGLETPEDVLSDAIGASFADAAGLEDALVNHTLHCLAYLLASKRLQIRIVLVEGGIFHVKEWILRLGEDTAVLAGSANFTGSGLKSNVESLYLHRSWRDLDNLETCEDSMTEFQLYWNGHKQKARTVDMPTAIADDLIRTYGQDAPPTEFEYESAQNVSEDHDSRVDLPDSFRLPEHLEIWEGPYSHQGRAIEEWEKAGCKGILAMATGAGKTISALAASLRLNERVGALLIVIAVPTKPLVSQWGIECADFGLRPIIASVLSPQKRLAAVRVLLDNLTFGVTNVEAIIVTNDGLVDASFNELLEGFDGEIILIADEVHNLGIDSFLSSPPQWAKYRLGLSATPERQYDLDGTAALFDYFGDVVFEYSLEDAIGVCLVPYDYFIHSVELSTEEFERYSELSIRIRKRFAIAGGSASDDLQLTILLNQRRLILETAKGKLLELCRIIDAQDRHSVRRTLFYATDKDPQQLIDINHILSDRRIRWHQVTEAETGSGRLLSATLDAFAEGKLQALTAKRVLDEGLNVPQIDTAYILASTTVRKQWTQRRGRVLRPSPKTGKTHATIHDFLVLPPTATGIDDDETRLVRSELDRCDEFARLARNRASLDGPYGVLNAVREGYLH